MLRKIFFIGMILVSNLFFFSCSDSMGYSTVLWTDSVAQIPDGTLVHVLNQSNILHVYIIENPITNEKLELPLWQITTPLSKKKALALASKYLEYQHTWASVKIDGLPVRAKSDNTAKQVYRLRKNEEVRVLYKGEGVDVMSGKNKMEGDWLYILTEDGTSGWCFSYNLNLFQKTGESPKSVELPDTEAKSLDELPDSVKNNRWYPKEFADAISEGRIDPDLLNPEYGFFPSGDGSKVRIYTAEYDASYDYAGVTKKGNQYKYKELPITITVQGANTLIVQYTDSSGKPKLLDFVAFKDEINIASLIQQEYKRREQNYEQLLVFGPDFTSSNYGKLHLNEDKTFIWKDFKLLQNSLLSKSAKGNGKAQIKYLLDKSLSVSWDGVLTMQFEGMEKEINFLYKMEEDGLRLQEASRATFKGNTLKKQSSNALVLYFNRDQGE